MTTAHALRARHRLEVGGVVQGVGFRPFVYVLARRLHLSGSVGNTGAGVQIEVEGDPASLEQFARSLVEEAPPLAAVGSVRRTDVAVRGGTEFTIVGSTPGSGARTLASPDVATCADCLAELADPSDRRHRHPFVTCTNCGPRFTIITDLPYDRATTTMAGFEMCAACRVEYDDPADRRFHAQPVCCHDCGPRLELVGRDGDSRTGEAALTGARELLAAGGVVAVKGLGGYHLACDARSERAVAELRRRKQRGAKPFAVMVADLAVARTLATMTEHEEELLTGIRRPVVLLPRRARPGTGVAPAVAPGNPDLGLFLPYTPVHTLLFGLPGDAPGPDALVMTSANLSGEPIVTDDEEALTRLAPFADAWLRHDRPIQIACDDSVTRSVAGAEVPIRRSRGYAPLPVALPFEVAPALAAGADLKNTCAVAQGRYAWVSQHVGDMDDLATVQALTRTAHHLQMLTGVEPGELVCDAHPGYRSGDWAREQADGRPLSTVQHHHAHIASVMAEHGLDVGQSVVGVALDGTGYGTDGAVWGGEVLVCDYKAARRWAHLAYVPLAGGDASVLRPYRMAMSHLRAAGVQWADDLAPLQACPATERRVLEHQLETGFGTVPTSSMGRLFDAVASLCGLRQEVDYEAQAAIELEGFARQAWQATAGTGYRFALTTDDPVTADAAPVVRAVVADLRAGRSTEVVAARFHHAVVDLVAELVRGATRASGLATAALGGGVFANTLVLEAVEHTLRQQGLRVLRPRQLPPNDGGIALGQIVVNACR